MSTAYLHIREIHSPTPSFRHQASALFEITEGLDADNIVVDFSDATRMFDLVKLKMLTPGSNQCPSECS